MPESSEVFKTSELLCNINARLDNLAGKSERKTLTGIWEGAFEFLTVSRGIDELLQILHEKPPDF